MKNWIKKLAAACLFALLTLGLHAAAEAAPELRFCWETEGREISILPFEKKAQQEVWLFLPGALKGKDPVIRIDQDTDLVWGETTYANGSVFPAESFVGQTVTAFFSSGRRIGNVHVMQGSEIPAMFFTMDPADYSLILKKTKFDIKSDARLLMLSGDGTLAAEEAVPSFKTHGNSTFFAPKKAYVFQMAHKEPLAGMEKNKKWMLLANWFDISLIRNQITFDLCREIGLTSTPDCRQTDLYINGAYCGTYLLTEKIQLKKGRLEISDLEETLEELNGKDAYDEAAFKKGTGKNAPYLKFFNLAEEPEDVSGGYLLEIEKSLQYSQMTSGAGFVTEEGMCIVVKEPTHAGRKCLDYISELVNDFHNAVLRKDGISKETGRSYASYIDMRSFALKIAVEEFTANYDVRAASQYMYKDRDSVDGLLYAGPGWDYDLTYGNKDDGVRTPLKEDYVFRRSSNDVYLYHWLLTHEDFRTITRQLYDEVFLPAAEILAGRKPARPGSPLKKASEYQAEISESAAMNFSRWSARAIPDVWNGSGRTFEDAGAFVESWIDQRLDLMTQKWLLEE